MTMTRSTTRTMITKQRRTATQFITTNKGDDNDKNIIIKNNKVWIMFVHFPQSRDVPNGIVFMHIPGHVLSTYT